jgi:HNH endonuclease
MRLEFTKKIKFGGSEKLCDDRYHEISRNRFIDKVKIENECWIWCGYIAKHGYGVSTYRSKSTLVHRLSWILFRGNLVKDLDVCHHCDNPKCVNPDHLFLGTAKDNIKDCFNKKRKSHVGEKHPGAKLTEKDVLEIFELRKNGWTHQKISDRFKIRQGTVSQILYRRIWKHVMI